MSASDLDNQGKYVHAVSCRETCSQIEFVRDQSIHKRTKKEQRRC